MRRRRRQGWRPADENTTSRHRVASKLYYICISSDKRDLTIRHIGILIIIINEYDDDGEHEIFGFRHDYYCGDIEFIIYLFI